MKDEIIKSVREIFWYTFGPRLQEKKVNNYVVKKKQLPKGDEQKNNAVNFPPILKKNTETVNNKKISLPVDHIVTVKPEVNHSSNEIEFANITLGKKIGHGAFGDVYEGNIKNNTTSLAIKKLKFLSVKQKKDFENEKNILSKVNEIETNHFIKYVGCSIQDESAYIIMEKMSMKLSHYIKYNEEPADYTFKYAALQQLSKGLAFLHDNMKIVHCDIKPQNVFLSFTADGSAICKWGDFGLSMAIDECKSSSRVRGSLVYMPAELLLNGKLTPESDVFAFAITMWHIAGWNMQLYKNIRSESEYRTFIARGGRENVPATFPIKIAKLITLGWKKEVELRLSAAQIAKELESPLEELSLELRTKI